MKKILTLIAICVLTTIIVGCTARQQDAQIEKINNLAGILQKSTELAQQFQEKKITADELETLTRELEEKYEQLTANDIELTGEAVAVMKNNLDTQFDVIAQNIQSAKENTGLPDRAKKLLITEPDGLNLVASESKKTTVDQEGFDSIVLVYTGDYQATLTQAKLIAEKANIPLSKEFQMMQEAISGSAQEDIIKLTGKTGDLLKGIVYTNAGLLDNDMKYLITIAVDEKGNLILEATNYEQMKK